VTRVRTTPAVAIIVILLSSLGDYAMVLGQFVVQFDGVVVARTDDLHYPPWTRNRVTRYVIHETDGRDGVYHADPSEGGGSGFPIGTVLRKQRWHLDYEENGQPRNDFPLPLYFFFVILDTGLLAAAVIVAIMIQIRDAKARELAAAVERGQRLLKSER